MFKPLNPNPDSNWLAFFKDNEVLLQIDKDCRCVNVKYIFVLIQLSVCRKVSEHLQASNLISLKRPFHCLTLNKITKVRGFFN